MSFLNRVQRTTYLIDSENVCDAWIQLLPELKKKDRIIVFYTDYTANLAAECVSMLADYKGYEILWEKCFTGNNALDFQLISRLGYYLCKRPRDKFVIMSNDTGYDPAIQYWVGAGFQVERMRGKTRKQLRQEKLKLLPGSAQEGAERSRPKKKRTSSGNRKKGNVRVLPKTGAGQPERAAAEQAAPVISARLEEHTVHAAVQVQPSGTELEAVARNKTQKENAESLLPKLLTAERSAPLAAESPDGPVAELPRPFAAEPPMPVDAGAPNASATEAMKPSAAEALEPSASEASEQGSEPELPVECILGICRSVSVHKLGMLHEALVALLGMENGREVYHFLKSNREMHEKLLSLYLQDKNERVKNYIQSVLVYHQLEPAKAEEVKQILFRVSPKNPAGCYKALRAEFGREEGEQYYAALKSHLQMIRKV